MSDKEMEAQVGGMDAGKRVKPELAEYMRATRVADPFAWIDTIVIGPGAQARDPGWFNNWSTFANATDIIWHTRRNPNVGKAYTNRPNERLDYAFDLFRMAICFDAPVGSGRHDLDITDQQLMPIKFTHQLPREMSFSLDIASTDNLLELRGDYAGAGGGPSNTMVEASPTVVTDGGNNGVPYFKNMWAFPEPVMVPAGATLTVSSRVNDQIKGYLAALTASPGFAANPVPGPVGAPVGIYLEPKWYKISVIYIGARYLQLRGARSAR